MAVNGSFASPLADAQRPVQNLGAFDGLTYKTLQGVNGWSVALSLFLVLFVYDQCMFYLPSEEKKKSLASLTACIRELYPEQGFNRGS